MKRVSAIIVAFVLLLTPLAIYAQSEQTAAKAPPVGQSLVPEGDFALSLVAALKLGTPATENEAEDILTKVGITPKNGWIADYPMTPIVVGQLQSAVVSSADSQKLSMGRDDALKAYQSLTAEVGLNVVAETTGQPTEDQSQSYGEYSNPSVINDYYSDEGPPVVTYYPPPPDYDYLYTWAPYPFWCDGLFFPGFFVLNDFDIIVVVDHHHHHHHHLISNHFVDPKTHTAFRVDPMMRTVNASVTRTREFRSTTARNGATSIFNRSLEKSRSGNTVAGATGTRGELLGGTSTGTFKGESGDSGRSFSPPSRSSGGPSMGSSGSFGGFHGGGGGFHGGGFRR